MARKNQRILSILGAAAGTVLTVFGIRRGVQWYRQRQMTQRYKRTLGENAWISEGRYQGMESAIPATGAAPTMAPPRTNAERVNSDRVSDYDDRGTAFRTTEMDTPLSGESREITGSMTGNVHGDDAERGPRDQSFGAVERGHRGSTEIVGGTDVHGPSRSYESADETRAGGSFGTVETDANNSFGVSPEDTGEAFTGTGTHPGTGTNVGAGTRTGMNMGGMDVGKQTQTGPQTGTSAFAGGQSGSGASAGAGASTGAGEPMGQPKKFVMDEYVAPLIEHAIAFNSVMNLLRSRQRDGLGNEGVESLTEGDRNSMRAVLAQMEEKVMDYDEQAMRKNPLAHRSYTLTQKLRDALDNLQYTGSDLYRIQVEIKRELCVLARELENSGQVTITGLDQIRQLYEC